MSSREEEEESGEDDVRPQKELFTLPNGRPVRFYFHRSLTEGMAEVAKAKIEVSLLSLLSVH